MANKNELISAPVDLWDDVCVVLESERADVGYLCGNFHGAVNPWAKYKPVEAPIPEWDVHKRYEERFTGGVLRWVETATGGIAGYRGARGDCGLSVTAMSAVNLAGSAEAEWKYSPPRTFYRLSDFDGYNHAARAPYRGMVVTGETVTVILSTDKGNTAKVYPGQKVRFELLASVTNDSMLRISDIAITGMSGADIETLDKAWFGLVVYTAAACEAEDYLCFLTADVQGGAPVEWEMPSRSTGSSLWLVPVLAKNRQRYKNDDGTLATLVENMVVRVPGVSVAKVTYSSKEEASGMEMTLTAKEIAPAFGDVSDKTMVTATLMVKATGRSYTGGGSAVLKSNGVQKASQVIEEFTIASGQRKTILISFGTQNWGGSLTVGVRLDGGYVKDGVVPIKSGGMVVMTQESS
ncbi:MAG: hypothetical protein K2G49_00565 [Muribaculum sp.]|nr:hypothetical protein [Muribaculum sp.]